MPGSEETQEALQAIIQSNGARLQNLASLYNAGVDMQRLMTSFIVEEMFPEPEQRMEFELRFQQRLEAVVAELEERASSSLVAPNGQGLLLPNGTG